MNRVFADTSFYVALLNHRDSLHANALKWVQRDDVEYVTTDLVLIELGNAMSAGVRRASFVQTLELLRSKSTTIVIPATHELFERGCALFSQRPDKEWSMTDCTSFVVMGQMGLTDALTADHHFAQAGFQTLLIDQP